jgi:hypothetical protein
MLVASDVASSEFFCLGIQALGRCNYNPASPGSSIFTVGDAIAALAFTLALQQFLKPIFEFRIRTWGIPLIGFYGLPFAGAACVLIGSLWPHLPVPHSWPIFYPIVWEIAGAILFGAAYAAVAFIALKPAVASTRSIVRFTRAGATLLATASEDDQVAFFADVVPNTERLLKRAMFNNDLRERSAFFRFTHRTKIAESAYAGDLLRIMADPLFCATLVRRSPWQVARMLRTISQAKLIAPRSEKFIQELARQAVTSNDSIVAREVGYGGFGDVPYVLDSLFGDHFIITTYNPFEGLRYHRVGRVDGPLVERVAAAAERCWRTMVEAGDLWSPRPLYDVVAAYETIQRAIRQQEKASTADVMPSVIMTNSVEKIYDLVEKSLLEISTDQRRPFYAATVVTYQTNHIVTLAAEVAYNQLESVANDFLGVADKQWMDAISVFMRIFPFHENEPIGMNPLQQHLAIKLIGKLKDNMRGYYPAIARVLLAVAGPYEEPKEGQSNTAYRILKDAMYAELKGLVALHQKSPEKVSTFLPNNVAYDPERNVITHTFLGGSTVETDLSKLTLEPVDLVHDSIFLPIDRSSCGLQ